MDEEEIQKAINHYEYRVEKRQEDIKVYRESKNQELMLSADMFERALCRDIIILAAMRQYRKPTDQLVSVAIWYQDSHIQKEECLWRDVSEEDDCEPGAKHFHDQYIKAHKLAIQALRQMKRLKHGTGGLSDGC